MALPNKKQIELLCIDFCKEEFDRDDLFAKRNGKLSHERRIDEIGLEKFEADAIRDQTKFVTCVLESIEAVDGMKLKKKVVAKTVFLDPEYVYELNVEVYKRFAYFTNGKTRIDGLLAWEHVLKKHTDKRGQEAGLKRFRDYCQIKGPYVRSFLTMLDRLGKLPKGARARH